MELWDIYDENREKQEGSLVRGEPIPNGAYHLVIHVCVFSRGGKMLIQKRQPFKSGYSGLWDVSVGGSAVKGDTSAAAAQRELLEEIGIAHDFSGIRPHLSFSFERGFDDFYLIEKQIDINTLKLQYEEVERVAWADEEEIISMIREGSFIPYYEQLIHLLFAMRKNLGIHNNGSRE